MNAIFFTPGPSQLFPTYNQHLQYAMELQLGSINHRSSVFRDIYKHTDEQLRILLDIPISHSIFFASSATELWERILLNLVAEKSYHFVNGAFSKKFFDFAQLLLKNPRQTIANDGHGFDMNQVEIHNDIELICTTQNETSTGVYTSSTQLSLLKDNNPHALLCSDLVSIAPYSSIDYTKLDCTFFSVQKAFGMPPGLGVLIVNNQCIEKSIELKKKGYDIGAHHTFESYQKNYLQFETPSTPNVMAIYLLGKIAEDMNQMGIQNIRNEIKQKAELLYTFANKSELFSPFVESKTHQSDTVIVLNSTVDSSIIINHLKEKGFQIGSGYGSYKKNHLRIANFPATSVDELNQLIELMKEFELSVI